MTLFIHLFLTFLLRGQCSTACQEPKFCECLSKCAVFQRQSFGVLGANLLPCDFNLLVVPNLGLDWNAREIQTEVAWAKEKLEYENQKTYEGVWKTHVLGGKMGAAKFMQALLGTQLNLVKMTYEAAIQERIVSANDLATCDIAKCLSFCSQSCESQCEQLDNSEESFLTEISWTKSMCDVDGSKALISSRCNDLKSKSSGCDAACDHASLISFSELIGSIIIALHLYRFSN